MDVVYLAMVGDCVQFFNMIETFWIMFHQIVLNTIIYDE